MSSTKKPAPSRNNRLVDIDGTVCTDIPNEYDHLFPHAVAFPGAAEGINRFYDDGDTVVFFTAREERHRAVTEEWLRDNGFKFHYLLMGKPRGGNYHWYDNLDGEFHKVDEHFWTQE